LGAGAAAVYPARDDGDARAAAARRPGVVIAGEYMARTLPGHAPATPLALALNLIRGEGLVSRTPSGSRAIAAGAGAAGVSAGGLATVTALARRGVAHHPGQPVLLLCAGSLGRFSLEDFIGAGHLARALRAAGD